MSYDFGDVGQTRRETMQAIESSGTGPEAQAEAALDELGVRYDDQPGYGRYRPDFRLEDGTVLQVMGCFWHCCPCQRGAQMKDVSSNEDYWSEKHRDNKERDERRRRDLLRDHDAPLVFWVWECQDVPERVAALCEARGLVDG